MTPAETDQCTIDDLELWAKKAARKANEEDLKRLRILNLVIRSGMGCKEAHAALKRVDRDIQQHISDG